MGAQACRLPALKPLKPSKPSKRSKPFKPLKTLKRWLGMLHPAANSHPEATHQWLLLGRLNNPLAYFILQRTGTPRPHINASMASYGRPSLPFRLPALKPLKPSKHSKPSKPLKTLKRWLGMLHPAANSHPEATHQWLLLVRSNNPLAYFILQPIGTPRPHINGFLWASKPAVCQPLNP